MKYVVLFAIIVEKAKGIPVSREEVFAIFIRGLRNEEFGEFLVSSGLKSLASKDWLDMISSDVLSSVYRRSVVGHTASTALLRWLGVRCGRTRC
jgi:hypothetical protein